MKPGYGKGTYRGTEQMRVRRRGGDSVERGKEREGEERRGEEMGEWFMYLWRDE